MRAATKLIGTGIIAEQLQSECAISYTGTDSDFDICVGQSEVVRSCGARVHLYTYIRRLPIHDENLGTMDKVSRGDADGTPAWFELRPNAQLIENQETS